MTIPIERTWSIRRTRQFLIDLLYPKTTPRVPKSIRREAQRCLRHFPGDFDIQRAAEVAPGVFGIEQDAVEVRGQGK